MAIREMPRRCTGKSSGHHGIRAGSSRGNGGFYGVRARKIYRLGRALLCDFRPGSDPSAERAVRRQDGSCPVVALVGQQARSGLGASYQQEVDLQNHGVTEYVGQASVPEQVRHLIDRAVRIAHNRRGVICVILPNDLQELQYADPPVAHGATHTGVGYAGPAKLPDDPLLAAAADVLNAGKKVAMLVAAGALDATDEIIAVAERLQARRESSARQGRRARRSSVRDRFDRIARDEAEPGSHEGL